MPAANWGTADWGTFDWGGRFAAPVSSLFPEAPTFNIGNKLQFLVTLAAPAPPGGISVALSSTDPRLRVPASVVVPEGQTKVLFTAYSEYAPNRYVSKITATSSDGTSTQAEITAQPIAPGSWLAESPYRVVVCDLNFEPIDEVPAGNLQYSYILNAAGSATFTLPLTSPKSTESILSEGQRTIQVIRNGLLTWGGWVWTIDADSASGVRVSCGGWLSRLASRYIDTDLTYTGLDQFDIAWNLIDFTQSKAYGELGITQFLKGESGITRTIAYLASQRTPILQALSDLAATEDGFDYEVTPDRVWVPYYPKKGQNNGVVFDLQKNILSVSWTKDAQNMANEVSAIGSSTGDTPLVSVQSDAAKQAVYGLLQVSTSWPDVTSQPILDAHALADLAAMKISRDDPQMVVTVDDPPLGSFSPGDTVHVSAHYGFIDIEGDYRIITIVDNVNNEGRDVVTLTFDTQI